MIGRVGRIGQLITHISFEESLRHDRTSRALGRILETNGITRFYNGADYELIRKIIESHPPSKPKLEEVFEKLLEEKE
ncbi:MAG: hypothetical protein QXQ64_06310 [Candidatus Bathyarchaeia archaeon]